MKYLILGANGLIGQHAVRVCKEKNYSFTGTCFSRQSGDFVQFNQLDFESIPAFFDQVKPTVVFNAIGLAGGVNFCEENPQTGRKYHVESTKIMADWCKKNNAIFVFISTDYVFDGQNPPYKEYDETNPLNFYGKFKLEGEHYIQETLSQYIIARTTNVFGWDPETKTPNFLMSLVLALKEKDSIPVPGFLWGNPTYAGDLVAGIIDLIENSRFGLYHIVGPGYISRYDWAKKLLEIARITGKAIEKQETPPPNIVPRPLKSNLNTEKFRNASHLKLKDIEEGLQVFVSEMK